MSVKTMTEIQKWFYAQSFVKKEQLKKGYAARRKAQTSYKGTFWTYITPHYAAAQGKTEEPQAKSEDAELAEEQKDKTEDITEPKGEEDTTKSPTPKADDTVKSPRKEYSSIVLALAIGALVYVALN